MPTVNGKKFEYTIEGLKKAAAAAEKANPPSPIQADQSVYGESNMNPNMNPDSNTKLVEPNPPSLANKRTNTLRRKKPRPYKANMNLT